MRNSVSNTTLLDERKNSTETYTLSKTQTVKTLINKRATSGHKIRLPSGKRKPGESISTVDEKSAIKYDLDISSKDANGFVRFPELRYSHSHLKEHENTTSVSF